jgi:hypothetical protein
MAASPREMPLLADIIRFAEPRLHVAVEFLARRDREVVDLIARRDGLDLGESRVIEPAGEHDVARNPVSPQADRGEAHAYLKRDPRLLGEHPHWTAALDEARKIAEQRRGARRLSGEMLAQRVARAEMRLIAVGERPSALRAVPERGESGSGSRSLALHQSERRGGRCQCRCR